jgi:hypothetical protein
MTHGESSPQERCGVRQITQAFPRPGTTARSVSPCSSAMQAVLQPMSERKLTRHTIVLISRCLNWVRLVRLRSPTESFRRNTTRIGSRKTGSGTPSFRPSQEPGNAGRSSHPKDLLWPTPEREILRSRREHSLHTLPCKSLFFILNISSPSSGRRTIWRVGLSAYLLIFELLAAVVVHAGKRQDMRRSHRLATAYGIYGRQTKLTSFPLGFAQSMLPGMPV